MGEVIAVCAPTDGDDEEDEEEKNFKRTTGTDLSIVRGHEHTITDHPQISISNW